MNPLQQARQESGVLIAAHRGTNGGNILQNTIKAYRNSIRHKADMFEVDVLRSADGIFYAFHDGQEPLVFNKDIDIREMDSKDIDQLVTYNSLNEPINQRLERLNDILETFVGETLINLDRSWFYWDTLLEELKDSKALSQILLKSPPEPDKLELLRDSGLNVMYMPIIKTKEELDFVLNFDGINTVAVELIFTDLENELTRGEIISDLKSRGLLVWYNSLNLSDRHILSAGFDDDSAIMGNGETWGRLVELGADLIQTDWPYLLYSYLVENNLKK